MDRGMFYHLLFKQLSVNIWELKKPVTGVQKNKKKHLIKKK